MGTAEAKVGRRYSPEEYLELERSARDRHEYVDGQIYAMAGESMSHSRICMNLGAQALSKLKGGPCEPFSPNMKVRTSNASLFSYPDLAIVCGQPEVHDTKKDVITNPKVIFEVLSPSTEKYDRTTKFLRYRMGNSTLTDYVLVSQDRPFVEHFSRQPDGSWSYRSINQLGDFLAIDSIGVSFEMADIYERVDLIDETEEMDGLESEETE